jgi:hypothetical protein
LEAPFESLIKRARKTFIKECAAPVFLIHFEG